MQIKTALSLSAGVALGWIFFEDNEKKEKAIDNFKRVMYKLQTGHDYPKRNKIDKVNYANYKPNYNGYATYNNYAKYSKCPTDKIYKFYVKKDDAEDILRRCQDYAKEYGSLSVYEFIDLIGEPVDDYSLNRIGWNEEEVMAAEVKEVESPVKGWKIALCNPHSLFDD